MWCDKNNKFEYKLSKYLQLKGIKNKKLRNLKVHSIFNPYNCASR